jgi:hypothetical protein
MTRFRPRLRFSLRTLFVLVTLLCVWMGYHLNWIRQRREARGWAKEHAYFFLADEPNDRFPFGLTLLCEEGVSFICVFPHQRDPLDHEQKIAKLKILFPEAHMGEASRSIYGLGLH